MKKSMVAVVTASLVFAGVSMAGGDAKKDLAALQGNWTVVSLKMPDGKDLPEEAIKGLLLVVKDDEMKLTVMDKTVDSFKIKLDASKQPKSIDFLHLMGKDKDKTELGIYKLEGDTLTLCTNDFEGDRPGAFAIKAGSKQQLLVFKKAKAPMPGDNKK